ncbi:hypothetical protein BHYA_0072g00190 [Botrytis hyacinthi]|uniref:Uncharacterized protein n=1 Tax=Botrytis hyacinthi TaxID=278943 RepID=A0A4Z1GNP7_9HELO|nr:hypothetical protein BHYA_0072g00190 [Botrytis hyacinthi]
MTVPYTSYMNSLALTHPLAMITTKLVSEYTADQVAAQNLMANVPNTLFTGQANFGVDAATVIRPEAFEKAALDCHLMTSDLDLLAIKGFQPLGGLSRIWAFNNLPVTNLTLKRSGATGSELNISHESVEGPKIGFVGDNSTVGDFLADAAMKSQKK